MTDNQLKYGILCPILNVHRFKMRKGVKFVYVDLMYDDESINNIDMA